MPTDTAGTTPDHVDDILESILGIGGFDPDEACPLGGEDRRVPAWVAIGISHSSSARSYIQRLVPVGASKAISPARTGLKLS